MSLLHKFFPKVYWTLSVLGAIYAFILALLTNVNLQRHAVYVHKIHTARWHNVSDPEAFGFGKNQVTPFYINTPDAEKLFCWHILPVQQYLEHQDDLAKEPIGPVPEFKESKAYKIFKGDPERKLVVNFHGNAGHVGQGFRPNTYRMLSGMPNTYVLACDYRGFGLSSGSPSESGLITDSIAIVDYALNDLQQRESRIIILGQSLGTAVSSAVTLYYLDPTSPLIPSDVVQPPAGRKRAPVSFAATVLAAPFTNMPDLLLTYRIGGFLPVLSPLRHHQRILNFMTAHIVDTWDSISRLQAAAAAAKKAGVKFNLQLLHARNDPDITFRESEALFEGVAAAMQEGAEQSSIQERRTLVGDEVRRGAWAYRKSEDEWTDARQKRKVELEITRHGGHNRIVSYTPVALAVLRAFEDAATLERTTNEA